MMSLCEVRAMATNRIIRGVDKIVYSKGPSVCREQPPGLDNSYSATVVITAPWVFFHLSYKWGGGAGEAAPSS